MEPFRKGNAAAFFSLSVRALLLLWIILIFIYFLRSNFGLLHNSAQPFGVFSALFDPYSFSLRNTPIPELLQAFVALGLTQALGLLTLRVSKMRLHWLAEQCLALPVGFGLSGVFLELLTMAGLLYPFPLWLLWMAMIGGMGWLAWRAQSRLPWPSAIAKQEAKEFRESIPLPKERIQKSFVIIAFVLIGLITLTTFWHALFYPETYWDSLILYLGYARMTFLEHAFPFKAEAQVGIGLGANYPHMFPTYGAMASTLFGSWSALPQRLICPVAGLAATGLVYFTCLETWKSHPVAAGASLLFRAVPYGIAYSTWASDYAFVILFTAAFIYAFLLFVKTPRAGELALLTLIPASAMHLNYLMAILWVPWLAGVLLTAFLRARPFRLNALFLPLRSKVFWSIYLIGLAIALPWYIRNTVFTNNPVYAFFPEIFTESVRVNPQVLRSAELEWFRVGDGIGKLAETFWDLEHGKQRDTSSQDFERRAGLSERLKASYLFWVGYDFAEREENTVSFGSFGRRLAHLFKITHLDQTNRFARQIGPDAFLLHWSHSYKMMILFPAIFFPSLVLIIGWGAFSLHRLRELEPERFALPLITFLTAILLLAYMYLLADFYLYQIIGILGPAAVCGGFLVHWLISCSKWKRTLEVPLYTVLCLQAIAPGLLFGLMNFKFSGSAEVFGQRYTQTNLDAFRNPGMRPELFYRLQYGPDVDMWEHVNEHLEGERLLTHENRHYVLDPSITLVHLDDWDIQKGYNIEDPGKLYQFLRDHELEWYLKTDMHDKHNINKELGMEGLKEAGGLEEVYKAGDNILYRIVPPGE